MWECTPEVTRLQCGFLIKRWPAPSLTCRHPSAPADGNATLTPKTAKTQFLVSSQTRLYHNLFFNDPTRNPEALAMALGMPSVRDTKWLTLEVCRQFQRGNCSRSDEECKFAHPPKSCQVENGRVIACFDSLKVGNGAACSLLWQQLSKFGTQRVAGLREKGLPIGFLESNDHWLILLNCQVINVS